MIIQACTQADKGSLESIFPETMVSPQVTGGFSARRHGTMSLSYGQTGESIENRRRFLSSLDIDARSLVCAEQVHGSAIHYAGAHDRGRGALTQASAFPGIDGFITDQKDVPVALFSADCLIVFLYDPLTPAVGLVHAGWRGTRERITAKAVSLMKEHFSSRPEKLYAAFSPAIRGCCYRVGKEFSGYFPGLVVERKGGFYFDLARANFNQLLECGLNALQISDARRCSVCDNAEYFSYRCEAHASGRSMAVMMLR